mmetsp:Transcript_8209/g.23571  ORF Transcript_8209/g.23571 Transcript_8209/m.23571 type:complete len:357 (+) Transcript_8209:1677-2747(+)
MTGRDCSRNTANLFLRVSRLSSMRPLVSPRLRTRFSSSSWGHSSRMAAEGILTSFSKAMAWASVRGKPSRMKRLLLLFMISFLMSSRVISSGTSCPSLIMLATCRPIWVPAATSARMMSPVDRWVYPNSLQILAHCVPLPAPGPPNMKIMAASPRGPVMLRRTSFTFWYTSLGGGTAEILCARPRALYSSTTGTLCSIKVLNRFLMVSALSSARSLVSPLLRRRRSISSSGQSKKMTADGAQICFSNACAWSLARGKPSMRNLSIPLRSIAAFRRPMVTPTGTSFPSFIRSAHIFPVSEPLATSARRRSPAERCLKPKSSTICSHCVPLPDPGPPSTNTMVLSGELTLVSVALTCL